MFNLLIPLDRFIMGLFGSYDILQALCEKCKSPVDYLKYHPQIPLTNDRIILLSGTVLYNNIKEQKMLIILVLLIIIAFIISVSIYGFLMFISWIYSRKLLHVDPQKYQFTKGKVKFRVCYHPYLQSDIAFIHILSSCTVFIALSYRIAVNSLETSLTVS